MTETYVYSIDSDKSVTLNAADATNDRITRVGLRLDGTAPSVSNTDGYTITATKIEGAASASPSIPAIPDNQDSDSFWLDLAQVRVRAGTTQIVANDITDTRSFLIPALEHISVGSALYDVDGSNPANGKVWSVKSSEAAKGEWISPIELLSSNDLVSKLGTGSITGVKIDPDSKRAMYLVNGNVFPDATLTNDGDIAIQHTNYPVTEVGGLFGELTSLISSSFAGFTIIGDILYTLDTGNSNQEINSVFPPIVVARRFILCFTEQIRPGISFI